MPYSQDWSDSVNGNEKEADQAEAVWTENNAEREAVWALCQTLARYRKQAQGGSAKACQARAEGCKRLAQTAEALAACFRADAQAWQAQGEAQTESEAQTQAQGESRS